VLWRWVWKGDRHRGQGIFKAGNLLLRKPMVELAWLWLRHRPDSAPARCLTARIHAVRGRTRRITAVALARSHGVDPEAALRGTAKRFRDRLATVERLARQDDVPLDALDEVRWRERWDAAADSPFADEADDDELYEVDLGDDVPASGSSPDAELDGEPAEHDRRHHAP